MGEGHHDRARAVKQRYRHDCDTCIFLGYHEQYDLYVCVHPGGLRFRDATVIARYGNFGDYQSSDMAVLRRDRHVFTNASRGFKSLLEALDRYDAIDVVDRANRGPVQDDEMLGMQLRSDQAI